MPNSATTSEPKSKFTSIKNSLKKIISLYIENAKLTAAEKLTLLLSAATVFIVCFILSVIAIGFIAIALLELLSLAMSPIIAAGIMAGFFLLLALLFYLMRKQLVINPIAKFISKLIMDIGKQKFKA